MGVLCFKFPAMYHLSNSLIRLAYKKTSTFRITDLLCAGNRPMIGRFPHKKPSNEERIPM